MKCDLQSGIQFSTVVDFSKIKNLIINIHVPNHIPLHDSRLIDPSLLRNTNNLWIKKSILIQEQIHIMKSKNML